MNLEPVNNGKNAPVEIDDLFDDLDFKPITSGLGFHHKNKDPKPAFTDRVTPQAASQTATTMSQNAIAATMPGEVYQNDLSVFYNSSASTFPGQQVAAAVAPKVAEVKRLKAASTAQRFGAFLLDLVFISSLLSIVIVVMARIIHMDAITAWRNYPQEITPLVVSLFIGFYLMYFSIFDKFPGASLGKTLFNLKVVQKNDQKSLSFSQLLGRSFITLLGFLSLGLFFYFDLQSKVTNSEVVRMK